MSVFWYFGMNKQAAVQSIVATGQSKVFNKFRNIQFSYSKQFRSDLTCDSQRAKGPQADASLRLPAHKVRGPPQAGVVGLKNFRTLVFQQRSPSSGTLCRITVLRYVHITEGGTCRIAQKKWLSSTVALFMIVQRYCLLARISCLAHCDMANFANRHVIHVNTLSQRLQLSPSPKEAMQKQWFSACQCLQHVHLTKSTINSSVTLLPFHQSHSHLTRDILKLSVTPQPHHNESRINRDNRSCETLFKT